MRDNPGFSQALAEPVAHGTSPERPMQDKLIATGLTFDDVLLEPRYSDVVPAEVDVGHAAHQAHRARTFRCSARRWTR